MLLLAGCNIEADFGDALETEILPAEEYQQEIVAIDQLLFREEALGAEGVTKLETTIEGLAARVRAHSDSKFIKLETLELKLLAKHAARLSPSASGAPLQNDWMRIRNNLFDDRAWFARSSADLEAIAEMLPPPAEEATEVEEESRSPVLEPVDAKPRDEVIGRWQVVEMWINGKPSDDPELGRSVWSFEPPRIVIREAAGRETIYGYVPEEKFLRISTPSADEGWMRYELTAEGLRLAFYDNLKGRPRGFQPDPQQPDPALVVLKLVAVR